MVALSQVADDRGEILTRRFGWQQPVGDDLLTILISSHDICSASGPGLAQQVRRRVFEVQLLSVT